MVNPDVLPWFPTGNELVRCLLQTAPSDEYLIVCGEEGVAFLDAIELSRSQQVTAMLGTGLTEFNSRNPAAPYYVLIVNLSKAAAAAAGITVIVVISVALLFVAASAIPELVAAAAVGEAGIGVAGTGISGVSLMLRAVQIIEQAVANSNAVSAAAAGAGEVLPWAAGALLFLGVAGDASARSAQIDKVVPIWAIPLKRFRNWSNIVVDPKRMVKQQIVALADGSERYLLGRVKVMNIEFDPGWLLSQGLAP